MRWIQKFIRNKSNRYALDFQENMFTIYMNKFATKFEKLLTQNVTERPELVEYIRNNHDRIQELKIYMNMHKAEIMKTLFYFHCMRKSIKSTDQIFYLDAYSDVRKRVDSKILHLVHENFYRTLPQSYLENHFIELFIMSMCNMASELRKGFFHSELVAKTKITEHWVERIPVIFVCSFILLFMKIAGDVYVIYVTNFSYLFLIDIIASVFVCFVALYLVFLRVPQSIYAEAKHAASDTYILHKTNLHLLFLKQSGKKNETQYFDRIVESCFTCEHYCEHSHVGEHILVVSSANPLANNTNA